MSLRLTLITTWRIIAQLRRDHRTLALVILLPALLMVLMRYVFDSKPLFERLAPTLLAIFPFIVMFLVTSVATLRERRSGTLERLMTMPIAKLDLLLGYAVAFGLLAVIQVGVAASLCLFWLGLDVKGSLALMFGIAVLDAVFGMALGLFVSAFARTEFQAVQFMPLFAGTQVLLCGLLVPRDHMAGVLARISDFLPLSYAVDALKLITTSAELSRDLIQDVGVVAACSLLALAAGAATLRRRTA